MGSQASMPQDFSEPLPGKQRRVCLVYQILSGYAQSWEYPRQPWWGRTANASSCLQQVVACPRVLSLSLYLGLGNWSLKL